jgi:hypothetical protein
MSATATDSYSVLSLGDSFELGQGAQEGEREYVRVRRELGIEAFGAYASVRTVTRPSCASERPRSRGATGTRSCTSS